MCDQMKMHGVNNTGHTQNNGAVLIVNTIKTAPFFYVCPVYSHLKKILYFIITYFLLHVSAYLSHFHGEPNTTTDMHITFVTYHTRILKTE